MNDLSPLAGILSDMADELAESNDRADAVERARQYPNIDWAAKNAANRAEMRHGSDREVMTRRTDQVGSIMGCFVKNYAARR